jgi:hypothetical protein
MGGIPSVSVARNVYVCRHKSYRAPFLACTHPLPDDEHPFLVDGLPLEGSNRGPFPDGTLLSDTLPASGQYPWPVSGRVALRQSVVPGRTPAGWPDERRY